MKKTSAFCLLALVTALSFSTAYAQQQQAQKPDIDKIIEKTIENVDKYVHLDDVQLFFLDSIYQHNFHAMYNEMDAAKAAGSSNQETYIAISDVWMGKCDAAIEKILSPDQWQKYLRCGFGKEMKAREKREALRTQKTRKQ